MKVPVLYYNMLICTGLLLLDCMRNILERPLWFVSHSTSFPMHLQLYLPVVLNGTNGLLALSVNPGY